MPLSTEAPFLIDQEGYAAGLPVHAVVRAEGPVALLDASGRVLRELNPETALDEASGDRAALLDLGLLPVGAYTLRCPAGERGFTVSARPWRSAANALIKGLYFQRCGCALCAKHAGPWTHGPCHTAPAVDWEDRTRTRLVPGGWHDAGDYGKYVTPGAVTAAHLIYARLLFPAGCSDPLSIPETGSGVPDILSEARWELDWLLKMQREDGAFHHKLTKERFAPFIMPEDDRPTEFLMPVSHTATASACADLALASRVWRAHDAAFAEHALDAARKAWDWLRANPDFVPFRNPEGVRTGQYGDRSDADNRFWAACELYAATGEAAFLRAAEEGLAAGQQLTHFGWADVAGLGALCCLFATEGEESAPLREAVREGFLRQTEGCLAAARASRFGTALPADRYVWGSVLSILSAAMAMAVGHRLTGRADLRDAALDQLHYAFGMNALDTCFVTGLGERPVLHPHHRPSAADGIAAPVPGLISGGPNKCFPYPATRERLGEDVPPARYFLDETPSADTNEIAIYWNSPAVFVAACFDAMTAE